MTIHQQARRDFDSAFLKAVWRRLFSKLFQPLGGGRNSLLPFDEVRQRLPLQGQHSLGLQQILLSQIVGSVGRYQDFDRAFLPLHERIKDRWMRIDAAHLKQEYLPPVELIKMGEVYFVKDGNHRVSVARERGQEFIDAYVTEIEIPVPLTADTQVSDLDAQREYVDFMVKTQLSRQRPGAVLKMKTPEYHKLLEHISFHGWILGEQQERTVPFEEAALSWYDNVYQPLAQAICQQGLLKLFGGLTETDLYLWMVKYQWYLRIAYREEGEVAGGDALQQAKEQAARQLSGEGGPPLVKRLAAVLRQAGWVDTLMLEHERREFLEHTCLFDVRPDAQILATTPGQYEKLLDHIAAHRWYMGEQSQTEIPYDEAVASWFDNAYLPLVETIRQSKILEGFPGRTETDLYLWIVEYRDDLQALYGGEVPLEQAAEQFARQKGKKQ